MSSLVHENVVRYFTTFIDVKERFCILMEFCAKDLARCFESHSDMQNLIRPKFLEIFKEVIYGLEYIHEKHVIHRDLRPGNIFLTSLDTKCHAKIGDFGLSCYDDQSSMSYFGSPRYQAPEQPSGKYDSKVDMFAVGIILFELAKLDTDDPEGKQNPRDKILKNLRRNTKELLDKYEPFCPEIVKVIIASLLQEDPTARFSATEVREELNKSSKAKGNFSNQMERRENSGIYCMIYFLRGEEGVHSNLGCRHKLLKIVSLFKIYGSEGGKICRVFQKSVPCLNGNYLIYMKDKDISKTET